MIVLSISNNITLEKIIVCISPKSFERVTGITVKIILSQPHNLRPKEEERFIFHLKILFYIIPCLPLLTSALIWTCSF